MKKLALKVDCLTKAFINKIHTLKADERGISAVEFALILPILLITYLGTVEVSQGLTVSRNTTNIASTVADLIGQTTTITSANVTTVFKASEAIISPFSTGNMKIYASSFCKHLNDDTIVRDWGQSYNGASSNISVGDPSVIALLPNRGDSLIVAEAEYTYTFITPAQAIFKIFNSASTFGGTSNGFIIKDKFFVRPRNVRYVQLDGSTNCN